MRSYKVEIIETQKYVLDIQAESEAEAEKKRMPSIRSWKRVT